MKRKFILVGLIITAIVLYLFTPYRLLNMFTSKKTVQSVIEQYENEVSVRLERNIKGFENSLDKTQISLLAFKDSKVLELYAKEIESENWSLIKKYPFTSYSGKLGPKLKEGDNQIPEGIYIIESLNPNSSYHLSLRVSYPNDFDKKMALNDNRTNLGGDIMVHGKNVTIGCIPIGDVAIEELFVLAEKTFSYAIPIIISPYDFRTKDINLEIEGIQWETQLYDSIKKELNYYN